ncbi:MAG: glycosyl hydrolase family 28-related protein, partial [Planctomycetota bacterium]
MPKYLAFAGLFVSLVHSEPAVGLKPGYLSVMEFGAMGNWNYTDKTGADDTKAIQRAIDHASTAGSTSSVVYFPPGNYRVSSTIRLLNWVRLRGDNGRNSQIHADPQFKDRYMFHASNGKQSMFHSRIEELWIRVHDNPNIRAVIKADAWQENDGLSRVVITGFTKYGVEIEFGHGSAATLHIEDCEMFSSADAKTDSAGIYVHQISRVSAFLLRVDSTTISGSSAAKPLGYGIFMEYDKLVARVIHFECVRHGVYLDRKANAVL